MANRFHILVGVHPLKQCVVNKEVVVVLLLPAFSTRLRTGFGAVKKRRSTTTQKLWEPAAIGVVLHVQSPPEFDISILETKSLSLSGVDGQALATFRDRKSVV